MILFPEFILVATAILLILLDAFSSRQDLEMIGKISLFGVALSFGATFLYPVNIDWHSAYYWNGLFALDPLAVFFKRFFIATVFLVLAMSFSQAKRLRLGAAESFILPLFTTVGMMLLASAVDFMLIFVALELVTISFYVQVALRRDDPKSLEAGVKYLIIGALSTGFMVYGIAFVFGMTGSTNLTGMMMYLSGAEAVDAGVLFAVILLMTGIGFKLASVPFHIWAPDVYQGAPTPVTAFLSVGSKAAGIVVLLRVFFFSGFAFSYVAVYVSATLAVMAALSMLVGNFAALPQRNLKRLLGYSSIGHAGYLLMGLSCLVVDNRIGPSFTERGVQAGLVYLVIYLLSTLLAFHIISQHEEEIGGVDFKAYAGLAQRSPLLAFGMLISFVSLAGIPPLAGFLAKLGIFAATWEVGNYGLLAIGIVSAVAGLYYYLGVVRAMYWSQPTGGDRLITVNGGSKFLIASLCFLIILLGVWPKPLEALVAPVLLMEKSGASEVSLQ